MVRTFKNYRISERSKNEDATLDDDASLFMKAAANMKTLSVANLTPHPLAAHTISNMDSCRQPTDLLLCGVLPRCHIRRLAHVCLGRINWEVPIYWRAIGPEENAWDIAGFPSEVCRSYLSWSWVSGCFSVYISLVHRMDTSLAGTPPWPPMVKAHYSDQYRQNNSGLPSKLTNLRQFRFHVGHLFKSYN
jgi:hypothetical protein